jgi:membrane protein YqaA with SNARE-associated domain
MKALLDSILAFALAIGGVGVLIIAFLDSSFLSFPQANDLLVIWMVINNPALMPYYAGMATLGSVLGCLVLYHVARKGGEAVLRKRFHARHVDRAMGLFQRYGLLAVLVPSLLPPPAPFKLFVLLAGVAEVPLARFLAAVVIGRGVRYFGQGILAIWYGEQAVEFLKDHGRTVSFVIVGLIGLSVGAWVLVRMRRKAAASAGPAAPR